MTGFMKLCILLCAVLASSLSVAQNLSVVNGIAAAGDKELLIEHGQPWWLHTKPAASPSPLQIGSPSAEEKVLLNRARNIFVASQAKVIALMNGDRVVFTEFKPPATPDSLLFGYSMGKTVTSMAVGKAICAGKLRFDTRADDLVGELRDTALGRAKVRDLLRMASGTKDSNRDSTFLTPAQYELARTGRLDLVAALAEDRVSGAARSIFSDAQPGERFSYKGSDPAVLGLMVARAVQTSFNRWLQDQVLEPMGAAHPGLLIEDRRGNPQAGGGVILRLDDWMRFALWVKRSSREPGCFGDYVRASLQTQIDNPGPPSARRSGASFDGYGYLTWTRNRSAPDSAWALGYGGQRIGWSTNPENERMLIAFSNVENWMPELYGLAKDWMRLAK